jgi:hypothetical protein
MMSSVSAELRIDGCADGTHAGERTERGSARGRRTLARIVFAIIAAMTSTIFAAGGSAPGPRRRIEMRPLLPRPDTEGVMTAGAVDQAAAPQTQAPARRSPWLLLPVFSSSPKLGTAGGALVGYARKFDEQSRLSMFGVAFMYTSSESKVGAVFARTSFRQDHHRIDGLGVFGYVKNSYDDYLGTGEPLETNDDVGAFAARYRYRIKGNWFIGGQAAAVNYKVLGESALDDEWLDTLGVQGFKATGIGGHVSHDSRDNQDMPTRGWFANLNNLAYREWLGGDEAFDVYRLDARAFARHGKASVLSVRQNNEFTVGASLSGQATVLLRGYKQGAYIAKNMSSFEVEERLRFGRRWGVTGFGGVAALYGGESGLPGVETFYSAFGTGLQFVFKPDQQLLMNFEYAYGNVNNSGVYLKLGYAW